MIILYVGNVGAGKTLQAVRLMAETPWVTYYTNINTFGLPNVHKLTYDMIIKKEDTGKASRGKPVYEYKLNREFWETIDKPVSVILDEVHSILSSRNSMSHTNKIATQFLALLRKIMGQNEAGYGNFIALTQLSDSADKILREMCHRIVYFRQQYVKQCRTCGYRKREHSDMAEQLEICPKCRGHELFRHSYVTYRFKFNNLMMYDYWRQTGNNRLSYEKKKIYNCEKYFKYYDTLQIDNLFSDY